MGRMRGNGLRGTTGATSPAAFWPTTSSLPSSACSKAVSSNPCCARSCLRLLMRFKTSDTAFPLLRCPFLSSCSSRWSAVISLAKLTSSTEEAMASCSAGKPMRQLSFKSSLTSAGPGSSGAIGRPSMILALSSSSSAPSSLVASSSSARVCWTSDVSRGGGTGRLGDPAALETGAAAGAGGATGIEGTVAGLGADAGSGAIGAATAAPGIVRAEGAESVAAATATDLATTAAGAAGSGAVDVGAAGPSIRLRNASSSLAASFLSLVWLRSAGAAMTVPAEDLHAGAPLPAPCPAAPAPSTNALSAASSLAAVATSADGATPAEVAASPAPGLPAAVLLLEPGGPPPTKALSAASSLAASETDCALIVAAALGSVFSGVVGPAA